MNDIIDIWIIHGSILLYITYKVNTVNKTYKIVNKTYKIV